MCQAIANSLVYYRHTACCGVLAACTSLAKTSAPLCWPIYATQWTAMLRYVNMRILVQLWPVHCLYSTHNQTECKQYLDIYIMPFGLLGAGLPQSGFDCKIDLCIYFQS